MRLPQACTAGDADRSCPPVVVSCSQATREGETILEPARRVPMYGTCDVGVPGRSAALGAGEVTHGVDNGLDLPIVNIKGD